jgi:pseudaminic acid biosynthesis-associated methylase
MTRTKTEQEAFWAGEFGNEYMARNQGPEIIALNVAFFAKVLARTHDVRSVLEFGPNIGLNLKALRQLLPEAELDAVEINAKAVEALREWGGLKTIYHQSILDFVPDRPRDLVLIKGVLIHINPDALPQVYDAVHASSRRYVCMEDYYNPTPVEVPYRGHRNQLFKRDFAGELMDRHPDLQLVDYGFNYHRDPRSTQGDGTWFLLEKRA